MLKNQSEYEKELKSLKEYSDKIKFKIQNYELIKKMSN